MLAFGHRGFKAKYPENTLLSFQKAIEAGAHGVEFDVQLSSDGVAVIIHDETLDRTTDGSGLMTLKSLKELKGLNAAFNYPNFGFQEIPTLREFFEFFRGAELVSNIELKNSAIDYCGLEEEVLKIVYEFSREKDVIISSFNHESLARLRALDNFVKIGVLTECVMYRPVDYVVSLGADMYHPVGYLVDGTLIEDMHKAGKKVNLWFGAVTPPMEHLAKLDADGLILDDPESLIKYLGEMKNEA